MVFLSPHSSATYAKTTTSTYLPFHNSLIFLRFDDAQPDFLSVAQQPISDISRLFVEVSRLHTCKLQLLWKSDKLIAEATTYTTHNKHKRQTTMLSAQFKPTIPSTEQLQTYAFRTHGPQDWLTAWVTDSK